MRTINKVVRIGTIEVYANKATSVYCHIEFNGANLSITGVEGPRADGDAVGSCGQIQLNPEEFKTFAPGWNADLVITFRDIWKAWHLNDMRSGCEHQQAAGWDKRPIDPSKPLNTYGKHFEGQRRAGWNMLAWVKPEEHPEGLLTKPCEVCGYAYGTAWRREEVPTDVLEFLEALPDTDKEPAWV